MHKIGKSVTSDDGICKLIEWKIFLILQIILSFLPFYPASGREVQMTAHIVALVQVTAQPHKGTTDNSRCPLVTAPWRQTPLISL